MVNLETHDMMHLYNIAIDNSKELDTRYAALKLMKQKQKEEPLNYLHLQDYWVGRSKKHKLRREMKK